MYERNDGGRDLNPTEIEREGEGLGL